MERCALITGVTGQDGSYLSEFLLAQGYEVHGTRRRSSGDNGKRIRHLSGRITLHEADLMDQFALVRLLEDVRPREIYNLAAQSFVPSSWTQPVLTGDINALGVTRLLESVRVVDPTIRFYQASSSEMFGRVRETPQCETTPFRPCSPYAVAKAYAHWISVNYRESYGLYTCSGICFNHESPRRGAKFVTRKISQAVARIKRGQTRNLRLGNLNAERDWGFAGDFVEAMWLMLQQDQPEDYVIGTGKTNSVQQFVEAAFRHVGLDWRDYVTVDPTLYAPAEVDLLVADPTKAGRQLEWQPTVTFEELVEMMVEADLSRLSGGAGILGSKAGLAAA